MIFVIVLSMGGCYIETNQLLTEMTTHSYMSALTVADIALRYPQATTVFNRYHIDYCCGGSTPFLAACSRAGVSSEMVEDEIIGSHDPTAGALSFNSWSPSLLADYIQEQHHDYARKAIPMIGSLLDKVLQKHGVVHPELYRIKHLFETIAEELLAHMRKEEQILFPAIKRLSGYDEPVSMELPVAVMKEEHEVVGDTIKELRNLTSNYTPPQDACPTFQITYRRMEEFDNDLMQHVHLENNILFAKII